MNRNGVPDFAQTMATSGSSTRWCVWCLTSSRFSSVTRTARPHGLHHWVRPFERNWVKGLLNGTEQRRNTSLAPGSAAPASREGRRAGSPGWRSTWTVTAFPFLTRAEGSQLQVSSNRGDRCDGRSFSVLHRERYQQPTSPHHEPDPGDEGVRALRRPPLVLDLPQSAPEPSRSVHMTVNALVNGQIIDMNRDGILDFVQAGIPSPSTGVRGSPGGAFFRGRAARPDCRP